MKPETIYQALEHTSDEYINSAHLAMEQGKRGMSLRRTLLMAACISLAVAMVAIPIGMLKKDTPPTVTTAPTPSVDQKLPLREFTADEIRGLFNATLQGTPTTQYSTIEVSSTDDFNFSPIPDTEYLLIYENFKNGKPLDKEDFEDFTRFCYTRFAEGAGEEVPAFNINENTSYYGDPWYITFEAFPEDYGEHDYLYTRQTEFYNYFHYDRNDFAQTGIYLNSKEVYVDQTKSDEEILESIQWLRDLLFELFDETFTDVSVKRTYGDRHDCGVEYLQITFYNEEEENPLEPVSLSADSHYIQLLFDNYPNHDGHTLSKDKLVNVEINYVQPRHASRGAVAKAKMISLEQAEKLLEKGYVFGGYGCPLCMADQEPVDFTDYDYVKLTYVFTRDTSQTEHNGIGIPFYAFYKYIGDAKNGNLTYAYTYVPAIEVSDLEEYFQNRHNNHSS